MEKGSKKSFKGWRGQPTRGATASQTPSDGMVGWLRGKFQKDLSATHKKRRGRQKVDPNVNGQNDQKKRTEKKMVRGGKF